jgi:hypothetical protein
VSRSGDEREACSGFSAFSSVAEKKHSFAEESEANPKWGTGFEEPGGGSMDGLVSQKSPQIFSKKFLVDFPPRFSN